MLTWIRVNYTLCHRNPVGDYSLVGKVHLQWHKKSTVKSHGETFYVVDHAQPLVKLGATAFVEDDLPAGREFAPPQSPAADGRYSYLERTCQ